MSIREMLRAWETALSMTGLNSYEYWNKTMRYHPVFLNLTDKPSITVGDGTIAEGKATGLLEADPKVVILAPEVRA